MTEDLNKFKVNAKFQMTDFWRGMFKLDHAKGIFKLYSMVCIGGVQLTKDVGF